MTVIGFSKFTESGLEIWKEQQCVGLIEFPPGQNPSITFYKKVVRLTQEEVFLCYKKMFEKSE